MKKIITAAAILMSLGLQAQQSTGDVIGTLVSNSETKDPIVDARLIISTFDGLYQTRTDLDGSFRISAIPSGEYSLMIVALGDTMSNVKVNVPIDSYANLGYLKFVEKYQMEKEAFVTADDPNRIKLINGDLPVPEMNAKEIGISAVRTDISKLVSSMSSEIKRTDDGELVFRGARKGDMIYYMDGVKTTELYPIPSTAISRLKVYTGGLPAKYGDTLGGVIVMETKSYFDLYREWYGEELKKGNIK